MTFTPPTKNPSTKSFYHSCLWQRCQTLQEKRLSYGRTCHSHRRTDKRREGGCELSSSYVVRKPTRPVEMPYSLRLNIPSPLYIKDSEYLYFHKTAATCPICLILSSNVGSLRACCILYFVCNLTRESAGMSRAASNNKAVAGVILRCPLSISFTTVELMPIALANCLWEIPLASNSSLTISPGWVE